jgi:hypothetical protein
MQDHTATPLPTLDFLQHVQGQNKYGMPHARFRGCEALLGVFLFYRAYDNTKGAAPATLLVSGVTCVIFLTNTPTALGSFSLPEPHAHSMQRQGLQRNTEHTAAQTPTPEHQYANKLDVALHTCFSGCVVTSGTSNPTSAKRAAQAALLAPLLSFFLLTYYYSLF